MGAMNPMASMPGFEAMKAQQEAFMKAMTGGMGAGWTAPGGGAAKPEAQKGEDLDDIKAQLADLQDKLSRMGK